MLPSDFLLGLVLGLGLAAALFAILRWRTLRIVRAATTSPHGVVVPAATGEGPVTSPTAISSAEEPALEISGTAPAAGKVSAADPTPAVAPATRPAASTDRATSASAGARVPTGDTLRLSQRIILHVYAQGQFVAGDVAPPGLCQAGMVEALGIPQSGIAAVLRRLEAAGVFTAERGHVRGHDRRLKVYRLTAQGHEIARELRNRPFREAPEHRAPRFVPIHRSARPAPSHLATGPE